MPETRQERSAFLGLLALMQAAADSQNWSYPYHNILALDAVIEALHDATRDGSLPVTAPASAPTLAISGATGNLFADQDLEVVQTFLDEYGRETGAGPIEHIYTGTTLADPVAAPTIGAVTSAGTGFEGGLLEVGFAWTDTQGGETVVSPWASVELPYLTGGLLSQVEISLPSTPSTAGAAGANIYAVHRSGNEVLAYKIETDSAQTITLTGAVVDCYRVAPTTNSTGAGKAIDITGVVGPAEAVSTRFYVRPQGEAWTTGDRRLEDAGVDTFDVSQVSYPITFTGPSMLAPGFPPTVSQIKTIRPIDLGVEVIGTLDDSHLPPETVAETELARSTGEGVMSGLLVSESSPAAMTVEVAAGEAMIAAGRFEPSAATLTIPAADVANPRIDTICLSDAGVITGPTEDSNFWGTPATFPTAPATPAGYLLLAEVSVPTSDTTIENTQITDYRDMIPTVQALEANVDAHEASADVHFTGTEKTDRLLSELQFTDLTDGNESVIHTHPGIGENVSGYSAAATGYLALSMSQMELQDVVASILEEVVPDIRDGWKQTQTDFVELAVFVDELQTALGPGTLPTYNAGTIIAAATHDFVLDLAEVLMTEVSIELASAGAIDCTVQFYEDAGRTVLAQEWANITVASTQDRTVWEFFGTDKLYGRITNNSGTDDLTSADVALSYRK